MLKVPFSPPAIGEGEIAAACEAMRSGWLSAGPKVAEFESAFRDEIGAPAAVAMSSCSAALAIGLQVLGAGEGDAVFVPTLTHVSTAHAAQLVGATAVICDVDPETLCLDPVSLEKAVLAARDQGLVPWAVMPVHYAGHVAAMDEILDIAEGHGLSVLEDAAHAVASTEGGHRIGQARDVPWAVAFSFYATKNLTTGEGGMLTCSVDHAERARLLANHGIDRPTWARHRTGSVGYDVTEYGHKANLTDPCAAMGLVQLDRLPAMQVRRAAIAAMYDVMLDGAVHVPFRLPGHGLHLYVVRLDVDREAVVAHLAAAGVATSVHFPPLHQFSIYRGDCPVADREYPRLLSLPFHPHLSNDDVQYVADAVRAAVRAA